MKVELDKKSLFALASDTRVEILKSLQPMRRTVSQLAETLNIDKAAVHRHLKKMEEGGLVTRFEDHGFVYYGLSWKARDLMSPGENTRIVIMLSSAWIMLGVVALIVASLVLTAANPAMQGSGAPYDQKSSNDTHFRQILRYSVDSDWFLPDAVISLVVGALASVILVTSFKRVRRPKQGRPEMAEKLAISNPEPIDD